MTPEQKIYWYNIGRQQCSDCIEEPEYGRMSKEQEKCWWAGWWSCKAGMPDLTDVAQEAAPQRDDLLALVDQLEYAVGVAAQDRATSANRSNRREASNALRIAIAQLLAQNVRQDNLLKLTQISFGLSPAGFQHGQWAKWRADLAAVGGWESEFVQVPASTVRKMIELGEQQALQLYAGLKQTGLPFATVEDPNMPPDQIELRSVDGQRVRVVNLAPHEENKHD